MESVTETDLSLETEQLLFSPSEPLVVHIASEAKYKHALMANFGSVLLAAPNLVAIAKYDDSKDKLIVRICRNMILS